LDVVAPPRRTEAVVAALTLQDLEDLSSGEPLPYHKRVVTALIWELKYRKNPRAAALAGEYVAQELMAVASEELGKPLLIPVPMHTSRRRERGYNQTELLCKAAIEFLSNRTFPQKVLGSPVRTSPRRGRPDFSREGSVFEYMPDVLVRICPTVPQQGLPKYLRLKNVKNSMRVVDPERTRGRVCVVVDDVTTTGATLAECKRALRAAGARSVHCVALARS
jgi:predicted amidophosphoribosyltransferase